jgi:transposase
MRDSYCMNTSHSPAEHSLRQVRVQQPERHQIRWVEASLDQLVPRDHRVRAVWAYVEALDLTPLYDRIQAVQGGPGRDAVDPRILMALWIMATAEAVSSARLLGRLCGRDLVYMWICGDVGVNHHLLSDFRVQHGEFLNELLTDTIATLMHQNLITLETVAQDGMRVRAHAGSDSFRREKTLRECREEAAEQVKKLQEETADPADPDAGDKRRQAAQQRAARERLERVEAALENLAELQQQREAREKGTGEGARCSMTDPEARNMKMSDGGFRPAYNVQFVTDADTRMIVSVEVTNQGGDGDQMSAGHQDVHDRYDKYPEFQLVDGGFATNNEVTKVEQAGTRVIGPMNYRERIEERGGDPHARRKGDSDEMFAFRQRMTTEEAKELLKLRPSVAEFPNAECRNRGLGQFRVRGLTKVKASTLWYALTFNLMRMWNLKLA